MSLPEGFVLWRQDEESDGLYIIESGVLRAVYHFADHTRPTQESMVPGTVAGELSTLSDSTRNATCTVERAAVVWKLSTTNLRRMEMENPELSRKFTRLVLKGVSHHMFVPFLNLTRTLILAAKLDNDILLSALAARQ